MTRLQRLKGGRPITVNGTLVGPDQDGPSLHRWLASAWCSKDARRAGSAIDPVVHIMTVAGKELAVNNDAPARAWMRGPSSRLHSRRGLVLVHDAKTAIRVRISIASIGSYPC
jgi:hypothetical protein